MERTGGLRSAGTVVSDVRGRLNAKFAPMEIALELEMSFCQLMRTMLVETANMQAKIVLSGFTNFLENVGKPFCRKPYRIPVYPKRFNLTTVGRLREEFRESLQLRISRRRKRNIGKHVLRSCICSSFTHSPMTPHFSDAPAVPSKSQGEEGTCYGDENTDNEKFSALKTTGDTSTDDCAIRHKAAPQKTESATCKQICIESATHAVIH